MRNISSLFSFTPLIAMLLGAVSSGLWFGVKHGNDAGKELLGVFGNLYAVHTCAHLKQFVGHPCFAFFQLLYSACGVCVYMHIYNKVILLGKRKKREKKEKKKKKGEKKRN